jgi:hypothetical protein
MKNKAKENKIWEDAVTLHPEDLAGTKIHLSLRLDPRLYRRILAEQKRSQDRTITATVERILKASFEDRRSTDYVRVLVALRNLLVHSALQDEVISAVAASNSAKANVEKLLTEKEKMRMERDALEELVKTAKEENLRATA